MDEATRVRNRIENFQPYTFSRCNRPEIKVACILDTFSYECFKYEATLEQLNPDRWEEQMESIKPHFLFVESAWRGLDNRWWGALFNRGNRMLPSQKEFLNLIRYCKKDKIKTVFWDKEAPVNYHYFLETAKLFDIIFTTDEGSVKKYVEDIGHNRIYVLPFAAQPVIHNPVNSTYCNKERVAFAGTWYTNHERQSDMRLVLTPAMEFGLHIFDRLHTFSDNKYFRFPKEYQVHIMGGLNYEDMLKAYKLYKVFLNVNSVKNSKTMFSRRVFEILAAGANIVSTYSNGIDEMFGNIVCFSSSKGETKKHLANLLSNPEYSQRLSLLGMRVVYARHTYEHRFNTILGKIGMEPFVHTPGVSMIMLIRDGQSVIRSLETYKKQSWKNKELLLGVQQNELTDEWRKLLEDYSDITIFEIPKQDGTPRMGDYLNLAITQAKYEYISVLNEEDDYESNFLLDLMNAFDYTDADIVGKSCYYIYSEKANALVLKNTDQQYEFCDRLAEYAIIVRKSVFESVKFPSVSTGFIQEFLGQCVNKGYKIFSADKYNYVQRVQELGLIESTDRIIGNVKDNKMLYEKLIRV